MLEKSINDKVCSFFGHRNAELNEKQIDKLIKIIKELILNKKVKIFLFGGHSAFNTLCHSIVTNLKQEYPFIKRIAFTCKNETCVLENEREKWEKLYSNFYKKEVHLFGVEQEIEHKSKYVSGKASYIERNKEMVDNSDVCIIYYKKDYQPEKRKTSKNSFVYYQPKSGTRLVYDYIIKERKTFINIAEI